MFDRNFCIRRDFISNPSSLKKRLMAVGLGMLLLSPFLVIFMLVYLFLRHAEQFYNHPSTASSRRWSNLSKWIFREFNEVDHLFKHRINSSVTHAAQYLKQFPSPIVAIVAKFISFVSGGFAAILIIIAFLEESLLEGHIFGRNLFWYAAVFGTVTAISRAAVTDELQVFDPEGAMSLVVQYTHYMPKRWRGKENTDMVRLEFETLFQYTGMMLVEEMASIFLTPYLLLFIVPQRVDDILQFISDFTVDIEGVGHVCSFSVFDFESHGNRNFGSPYSAPHTQRSSQGKMEKSFLSFQSSYPTWEPNSQGKQFLSTLRSFKEQKLQGQGIPQGHSPPRTWQFSLNPRGQGDMHSIFSKDALYNNMGGLPRTGYQLGSLWLTDVEQKNHPYLLDWYYMSRPSHTADNSKTTPALHCEVDEDPSRNLFMPFHNATVQMEPRLEENWRYPLEDRLQSHLGASSSSTPFLRESVFQYHGSDHPEHPTESHWWARTGPHSRDPQTSFLEPPSFGHHTSNHPYDNFSDRSSEQEQHLNWRNSRSLSKTVYMDDYDLDGEFNLPFNDIYSKPLGTLSTRPESQSSE